MYRSWRCGSELTRHAWPKLHMMSHLTTHNSRHHLQMAEELAALCHGPRAAARHEQCAGSQQRHCQPIQLSIPAHPPKSFAELLPSHNHDLAPDLQLLKLAQAQYYSTALYVTSAIY